MTDDRRRALEAAVYGPGAVDPADVAALRALATEKGAGAPSADDRRVDVGIDPDVPVSASSDPEPVHRHLERPARAWVAVGIGAVVIAGLIGAGVTQTLGGAATAKDPGASRTETAAPFTAGSGAKSISESLGAEYFDQRQSTGDRPDVNLPGIDPASTRRVLAQWGQTDGEASIWVARGRDKSFCLIMSVGSARAASSCTPLADAAATGVRLDLVVAGGGSISARWNLSAGLLELSPFPAQSDSHPSGTATPTP